MENPKMQIVKLDIGTRYVSGVMCFACKEYFTARETLWLVELPDSIEQFLYGYGGTPHKDSVICPQCIAKGLNQTKTKLVNYVLERTAGCIDYMEEEVQQINKRIEEQREAQAIAKNLEFSMVENDDEPLLDQIKVVVLKSDDIPF